MLSKETFITGMDIILNVISRDNALKFLPSMQEEYYNLLQDVEDSYFVSGIKRMIQNENIFVVPSVGLIRNYVKDNGLEPDVINSIKLVEKITNKNILGNAKEKLPNIVDTKFLN